MTRKSHDAITLWVEHGIDVPGKTVYVKGEIDGDTLDTVTSAFHLFGKNSDVTVLLNTPGGCAYSGMGIYDLMKSHDGSVTARVIGEACSMGCIILQAADVRQATKHSFLMHHTGTFGVSGHRKNAELYFEFQKQYCLLIDKLMLERINEKRTAEGQEPMTLNAWQKRDLWDHFLMPEQAIALGLLDEIYP